MPELPEVETIRRDLESSLLGCKLVSSEIIFEKTARNGAAFFENALVGKKLKSVSRRGKLLILQFAPDIFLLVHLKMTGQLIYIKGNKKIAGGHSLSKKSENNFLSSIGGTLPNKHTRAIFSFAGGGKLFFNDLRKFGYLKIVDKKELALILETNYGPEPLEAALNFSYLSKILKGKKTKIKALLLDQKLVSGLGNIYVDEALFAAGILPQRQAETLNEEEIKKLLKAINSIIKKAILHRGTTFSDYRDSEGKKGNFSKFLQVYGRGKELCKKCGKPLHKTKIAGRGSHYCLNCQK